MVTVRRYGLVVRRVKAENQKREGETVRQRPREESSPLGSHELNWPWRRLESWSPETHCSLKAVGGKKGEREEGRQKQKTVHQDVS